MVQNVVLFPFRLAAVMALLAACFLIDLYRQFVPRPAPAWSRLATRASVQQPPLSRRLAYFGVLAISLLVGTIFMFSQIGHG